MSADMCRVSPRVQAALNLSHPVVALESTLIAHGLPFPVNVETAMAAEQAIRDGEATPATIAVWKGQPWIGLSADEIHQLAQMPDVLKASRRDLTIAITQRRTAATTVSATMQLAQLAGIEVVATGGIGGAHREPADAFDISTDLLALSDIPLLVVCAGAKSILHIPRTLEILETLGVPVIGYQTNRFPAFYTRDSGCPVSGSVQSAAEAAEVFRVHRRFGGKGMLLAQPLPAEVALDPVEFEQALAQAEQDAARDGIRGAALTPFLLKRIAELSDGRSLRANRELIVANARLAAEVAVALSGPS